MGRQIKIVGPVEGIEVISRGNEIRELRRLDLAHGKGRWRKLKGFCLVRLPDGSVARAEVHWYQAHGIGVREIKVKRLLTGKVG